MAETYFYRHDNGAFSSRTVDGVEDAIEPPAGATEISRDEYDAGVAGLEAANAQLAADVMAAEQALAREDYEALIAAGIPEATARRMSGYEGAGPGVSDV